MQFLTTGKLEKGLFRQELFTGMGRGLKLPRSLYEDRHMKKDWQSCESSCFSQISTGPPDIGADMHKQHIEKCSTLLTSIHQKVLTYNV